MTEAMLRLLAVVLLFSLVCAEDQVCTPEGPEQEGCPLSGNSDFYGLGVRMGIYTQWTSSWLANNFLAEEIIGGLDTNSIFLLALFATVFYYSVQTDQIRVVDVLIIHQLCIGFLFSIMSLWGYRTMYYKTEGPGGRRHFGGFGTHFRLFLMSMITAYGVWFWLEGVEDGLPECDRRVKCGGLKTFFFWPMKVESWSTRAIQLVLSFGAATYYGIMAIAALAAGTVYVIRKVSGKAAHWELIEQQDSDVALTKRELTTWYIGLSSFNLFWIIFSIVSIEVTLNLNHMNNVVGAGGLVGPGQLIPLAIGFFSLVRILYVLLREKLPWLHKKEENSPSADSPALEHKYMGGLGLGMENRDSIYSPTSASGLPDDPENVSQAPHGATKPGSTLPPLPAMKPHVKRSLPHRILLAWLPWLGLYEWSKHSLTPSFRHTPAFGRHDKKNGGEKRLKRDSGIGFESSRPIQLTAAQRGPTDAHSTTTTDSPSAALLSSPVPQPAPVQRGLMAPGDDIEMVQSRRSVGNTSDVGMYDGNGYHDYYEL